MLIRESVSGYRHIDVGAIKVAFTMVCRDELFQEVHFAAAALYYVQSGCAVLHHGEGAVTVREGEVALVRQHAVLDIRKVKGCDGEDFRSIIFFLFPDFIAEFIVEFTARLAASDSDDGWTGADVVNLVDRRSFGGLCESLVPLFEDARRNGPAIREKTFEALGLLSELNPGLFGFLAAHARPMKIDLYEFMIRNELSSYSVGELARLTGRSLSAFKRDFHAVFRTTPHRWLLGRKMDHAERLLAETEMTAGEIYHMLGFNELSHFSATFKRLKGVPPTRVVRRIAERTAERPVGPARRH